MNMHILGNYCIMLLALFNSLAAKERVSSSSLNASAFSMNLTDVTGSVVIAKILKG